MRKSKNGFTLMELLVVIMIIALLIAILLPALGRVKDEANKARCGSVLHNMGIALHAYADENDSKLPYVPYAVGNSWRYIGYDNSAFLNGFPSPTTDGWATPAVVMGNSRMLYQCLVRSGKCTPDSFVCPSASGSNTPVTDAQKASLYDFPSHANISYSFQNNWGNKPSLTKAQGMPLMADRNPQYTFALDAKGDRASVTGTIPTGWYTDKNKTIKESANSGNHGGQGQNVLRVGGDVKWFNTPLCGMSINGVIDNIYTRNDGSAYGKPVNDSDWTVGTAADLDAWLAP